MHGFTVQCLLQLRRRQEAEAAARAYCQLPARTAQAADSLAYAARALGMHSQSNQLYRTATTIEPEDPLLWYNLATSERSFGRLDTAEDACSRAIALDANQFPVYLLRAELATQTDEHNHVSELDALLSRPDLPHRGRMFLAYALAKEFDDLKRYDEAFRWFAEGARSRRASLAYDVATDERKLQRIRSAYPPAARSAPDREQDSRRFIFVVGLPRAGTTLVERILTGLPGVRSNGETDNFADALTSALPAGGGDVFARAAVVQDAKVAAAYRRLADRVDAPQRDDYVLEKLPLNFLYLGAIRRALPEARVICMQRCALDSCFAMYRTLFGRGYPFSYDFEELARYFAAYADLMAHWRSTLQEPMMEVSYEELVARPAQIGARIADYCGIPWNEAAIHIQENASVSLTASASQVRRPIYGSSSGKWRCYHTQLTPLIREMRARKISIPLEA